MRMNVRHADRIKAGIFRKKKVQNEFVGDPNKLILFGGIILWRSASPEVTAAASALGLNMEV